MTKNIKPRSGDIKSGIDKGVGFGKGGQIILRILGF